MSMKVSEKLNGYWEEGYHFYIEIRDSRITIRDYARRILSETTIDYDADAVERGEKTPLILGSAVLSAGPTGNPMSWFEDFTYENGAIHATEGYSFMDRKDPYVLKKVKEGPFDHIIIRDEEFLPGLSGAWKRWTAHGPEDGLLIEGDTLSWGLMGKKRFHVVSYRYRGREMGKEVYLVPYNLTDENFPGFCKVEVFPDQLHTREIICDMNMPLCVFAREDMIDKIVVPAAAKEPPVNTMLPPTRDCFPPSALKDLPFPEMDLPFPEIDDLKKN